MVRDARHSPSTRLRRADSDPPTSLLSPASIYQQLAQSMIRKIISR
jgi:hypothetical protein